MGSPACMRADQISARIREAMVFVGKSPRMRGLREDMAGRGFDPKDRPSQQAATANKTLHGLNITLHDLGSEMTPWKRRTASGSYIGADGKPFAARVV